MKKLVSIIALLIVSLLAVSMVQALSTSDVRFDSVKVNGDYAYQNGVDMTTTPLVVQEGQTITIHVGIVAQAGANNVLLEGEITGYQYADHQSLRDQKQIDSVSTGLHYYDLTITSPILLDKNRYDLRLRVSDANTAPVDLNVPLKIEPTSKGVAISDVSFSPGNEVKAGRSLLATVLLQNYGDTKQRNIKVTVAIPTLGISATQYVNSIDVANTDNTITNINYQDVPQVFLPIPASATAGNYDVVVTVNYAEFETISKTYSIKIDANELFAAQEKLVLAVGPESQSVGAGSTATYAIALSNAGQTSKAYALDATTGGDWASATVSDVLVVLEPGQNKVVYVNVNTAANANAGDHIASVNVKSGSNVLQTLALKTTVTAGTAKVNLRNGVEVALAVLVVLLVIVALVIGFSKLKKDDKDENQTYY